MKVLAVFAVLALGAVVVNGHAGITNPPCRTWVSGNPSSQCGITAAAGAKQCGYLRYFPQGCPGAGCSSCTNFQTDCIWTLATGCGEPATGTMTTTPITPGPYEIHVTQNVAHANPTASGTNFTALNSYTFYLSVNNHAMNGNIFLGSFKQPSTQNQKALKFTVKIPPMPYGEPALGFIQMQFKAYDGSPTNTLGYKTYYSCSSVSIAANDNGQSYDTLGSLSTSIDTIRPIVEKIDTTLNADNVGVITRVKDIDDLVKATRGVAGGLGGAVLFITTVTLIIAGSTCRRVMEGGSRSTGLAI